MLEKSRGIRRGLETILIISAFVLAFCLAAPSAAHAQLGNLGVFAVNHLDFGDTNEVVAGCSILHTPGTVVKFYDNPAVLMTSAIDVVLVTLSATGDTHGNNAAQFQCKVDGTPCQTGNIGSDDATGPGWVVLEHNEADEHDNTVNYTWCVKVKHTKNSQHEVVLNMQDLCNSSTAETFIEQVNVVVEGYHAGVSKLAANACTTAGTGSAGSD